MKRYSIVEVTLVAALFSVAVILICAIVYLIHVKQPTSFATTPPRIANTFRFDPKPDMTSYELALSISLMMGGLDYMERIKPTYDAMPPEVQRHWLPPEPKK